MNINEAKNILNNAGYLVETYEDRVDEIIKKYGGNNGTLEEIENNIENELGKKPKISTDRIHQVIWIRTDEFTIIGYYQFDEDTGETYVNPQTVEFPDDKPDIDEAKEVLEKNGYLVEESERFTLDDETLKEKGECANTFIHSIAGYTDKYFEGRTSKYFKDYGIETMRQIINAVYEYAEKMCKLNGRPCDLETLKQLLKDEYFVNYNWKK